MYILFLQSRSEKEIRFFRGLPTNGQRMPCDLKAYTLTGVRHQMSQPSEARMLPIFRRPQVRVISQASKITVRPCGGSKASAGLDSTNTGVLKSAVTKYQFYILANYSLLSKLWGFGWSR